MTVQHALADETRPRRSIGRRVLAGIGWLFLAIALGILVYELTLWHDSGRHRLLTLGEMWFRLDPAGLNLAQAVVQRHISPALWDTAIVGFLLRPAWPSFALSGGILLLLPRLPTLWRRWRG